MNKLIIALAILLSGCGGDLAEDKFHVTHTVTEVVMCYEGDIGFECLFKVGNGTHKKFRGAAYVGQTLYQLCWKEDDGAHCFVYLSDNLRSGYGLTESQL